MLSILLALMATQIPCAQGETSISCHCKQGIASACEVLTQTEPEQAAAIEQALEVLKLEEETRKKRAAAESTEAKAVSSSNAPEPPDCKGQQHHIISRRIAKALEEHPTLSGLYTPRDPRFVARAADEAAHCGYQDWHRKLDDEVLEWLTTHPEATKGSFEEFLRWVYSRPAMRARFPHGF